jgi:two-component system response regulator AtoC
MTYRWPGNIRELENCMERAMILSDSQTIKKTDLPPEIADTTKPGEQKDDGMLQPTSLSIKDGTKTLEKRLIGDALSMTNGNLTKAAKMLDISYRALLYKLKDYGFRQ